MRKIPSYTHIDPVFEKKIPPLTQAEYEQLEENILSAGRIFNPIIIWRGNGAIIDGHNRYKIYLKHPNVEIDVKEMDFADQWEAFDWMYKNQLGRRNLTEEQKTYLLGKLYEARKHVNAGAPIGNKNASKQWRQNGAIEKPSRAREQIMAEQGVGQKTVERSGDYAKGIDIIRQNDPNLADEILNGQKKVPKVAVQYVSKTDEANLDSVINAIKEWQPITGHKDTREVKAIARTFVDENIQMEFTVDHLIEQIRCNADGFINSLSNLLMDHKDLCNENNTLLAQAIDKIITERIDKIKERLTNGTQL